MLYRVRKLSVYGFQRHRNERLNPTVIKTYLPLAPGDQEDGSIDGSTQELDEIGSYLDNLQSSSGTTPCTQRNHIDSS